MTAGGQHPQPAPLRARPRLSKQARLPQPRRRLDHAQSPPPPRHVSDQPLKLAKLTLALEQPTIALPHSHHPPSSRTILPARDRHAIQIPGWDPVAKQPKPCDPGGVPDRDLEITLELHYQEQTIHGRMRVADKPAHDFVGWLGLLTALERLSSNPEARPPSTGSPAPTTPAPRR